MERLLPTLYIIAILTVFLFSPTGDDFGEAHAEVACTCHDGRMPCEPKQEYLELAGSEYGSYILMAFRLDESMKSIMQTRRDVQEDDDHAQFIVVKLIKVIRSFETQNNDLLYENIALRLENQQLQGKSEEYLQQARFHLCRYRQQRDYGTYDSSCLEEMEGLKTENEDLKGVKITPIIEPPKEKKRNRHLSSRSYGSFWSGGASKY